MEKRSDDGVRLHHVALWICQLCLDGRGGQCHVPGCALIRNAAPDIGIPAEAYRSVAGLQREADVSAKKATLAMVRDLLRELDPVEKDYGDLRGTDADATLERAAEVIQDILVKL